MIYSAILKAKQRRGGWSKTTLNNKLVVLKSTSWVLWKVTR
ncbi:hypothetical protein VEx25_0753 [Vibrio antiquarius]|uniref:Uncharacterized protein n=1 Tax=Vibrio antiquarius (strain Ex25) TaxID=150340 RepID=A0ABM9WRX4_VIBAE|nr:hypothetical protein VEx25_0753 [Vibrio antiquarius]